MPFDEFIKWTQFLSLRPPEWRSDNRAAAICSSMGAKAKDVERAFPSLQMVMEGNKEARLAKQEAMEGAIDSRDFFKSQFFHKTQDKFAKLDIKE